jgi:4-carboxymuconolactone decarboxylase
MPRMTIPPRAEMDADQGAVYDEIVNAGGRLGGPYGAYIRIPRFMKLNQDMGDYLRSNTLAPRLRQLAAIVAIRHWSAKFPWATNAQAGIDAGLSQAVVDSINRRERPDFADDEEALVFDIATELLEQKAVSDATYKKGVDAFGETTLVDIIVTTGFYSMVCMTVVTIQTDPPANAKQTLLD